jgi:integrase
MTWKFISRRGNLHLRITKDRVSVYKSLSVPVEPDEITENKISRKCKSKAYADEAVRYWNGRCEALRLEVIDSDLSAQAILKRLTGVSKSADLFEFADKYISRMSKQGTIENRNAIIQKLKSYRGALLFSDITFTFLKDYEAHLLKFNKVNTVARDLRFIKALFNAAEREEVIRPGKSPFRKFKIRLEEVVKVHLTEQELAKIKALKLEGLEDRVRDVFFAQILTLGSRVGDVLSLKKENLNGNYITFKQRKTGAAMRIFVTDELRAIIDRYDGDFLFPFLVEGTFNEIKTKTALINKYLKKITMKAEIQKKVSTHTARHTVSHLADSSGVSMLKISKMLGHKKASTTDNYLRSINTTGHEDEAKIISKKLG